MGKKSRVKARTVTSESAAGEVGRNQPCPCGSGRRYKACHGNATGAVPQFAAKPFDGIEGEVDLIALREFVPAATAPLTLVGPENEGRVVQLCSLLPGAAPALVRQNGAIWLGLQVQHSYGDPSRDLAAVLTKALDAEPGTVVGLTADPGEGPRLQDLITGPLEVTVHEGFDYWLADLDDADGAMAATLEQANGAAAPTVRIDGVDGAYRTAIGNREYLRWVMPHDEDHLLDALARLHAAGEDKLVEGARLIGMFRAHGRLAPVWDLPVGTDAGALAEPVAAFAKALEKSLASDATLTGDERAARSGLANRQLTIR